MKRTLVLLSLLGLLVFAGVALAAAQSADRLQLIRLYVADPADDINEDGGKFDRAGTSVWLGNGDSVDSSYLGLRFQNVSIPPGAEIVSAHVAFYEREDAWIALTLNIAADAADDSAPFAGNSLPSSRTLTEEQVTHESNVEWLAANWYALDNIASVIQEVIDRPGWAEGNSLSVIVQGNGEQFGRKFVNSFEGDAPYAPSLVVLYREGS